MSKENLGTFATFSRGGANPYLMGNLDPDWREVVGDIGPKLYRYFCGIFDPSKASDLVQETLIRLVNKYRSGEFDEAKGSLTALAFGIARFVRLEAQKQAKSYEVLSDGEDLEMASPIPIAHDSNPVAHLRWANRQLSLIEQEILLRVVDEECQLDQIAADLDIPLSTVKSHVHRAKEKIRKLMEVQI